MIKEESKYFATSGRIKYYPLVIDHGYGATLVDIDGKDPSVFIWKWNMIKTI